MKLKKEEFRKKVKKLGYEIRFKKVLFDGRDEKYVPIVKKDGKEIGGNVFSEDFYKTHKEVLNLLSENKIFNIEEQ